MFEDSKLEKVLMPNPVAMTRVGETLLLPESGRSEHGIRPPHGSHCMTDMQLLVRDWVHHAMHIADIRIN